MSDTLSGKLCIKILCRYFGFFIASQKGSHVKLRRTINRKTVTTIVPLHKELTLGTLKDILKFGEVDSQEFEKYF